LTVLLALALVAGAPTLDSRTNDALFSIAQEDFVYRLGRVESFRAVLSPSLARLVGCLGCDRYDCRELAGELIAAHPEGLRAAAWGVHAVDPDVSERCLGLLRGYLTCPHCGGGSYCPAKERGDGTLITYHACRVCDSAPFPRFTEGDDFRYDDPRADHYLSRCLNCNGTGNLLYLVRDGIRPGN
jgi:hypothetical protein